MPPDAPLEDSWVPPRTRYGDRARMDVVIVGAGIVGLATARALVQARPGIRIALIEKEPRIALHQTGNNSGVIHSGIYYRPGSLKARLTVEGKEELERYCKDKGVPYEICGKVVVATRPDELPKLEELHARAQANGVPSERIDVARLRELEPHADGIAALHVTSTGIVNYYVLCEWLADDLVAADNEIRVETAVTAIAEEATQVVVDTTADYVTARVLVNCAGLQSDRVANLTPESHTDVRIMPFRGEYYKLLPSRRHLVNNLIYPVPDPRFPFLGVHFTRMITGGIEAGPNAVPALAREGYRWAQRRPSGHPGAGRRPQLAGVGPQLLAHRAGRDLPMLLEEGVHQGPAAPGARRARRGPRAGRCRRAGPGHRPGRGAARRLRLQRDRRARCTWSTPRRRRPPPAWRSAGSSRPRRSSA